MKTLGGSELVESMEVKAAFQGKLNQAELSTRGADLVMHARIGRCASGIIGDLQTAVPGQTGLSSRLLSFFSGSVHEKLAGVISGGTRWVTRAAEFFLAAAASAFPRTL